MLHIKSLIKAISWLFIGIFFGLASFVLIFASSVIFGHPITLGKIVDNNIIMFLCVALMSGAGSDFSLSDNYHWGVRIAVFFTVVIALLIVCVVFNPSNNAVPDRDIVKDLATGYAIFTIIYCVGLKGILFYKEAISHKKLKFR